MRKVRLFLNKLISRVLLIVFIFLLLVPKNWPTSAQRFIVWSAGLSAGVRITHLDLFLTHVEHESHFRQFENAFGFWGFSFGKPLIGISGDVGIGQISPLYHQINFATKWSTFLNARQAAKYFAEGCVKGESCSYTQAITHYTGKAENALQQNPPGTTLKYFSIITLILGITAFLLSKNKTRRPLLRLVKSLR